MPVANPEQYHPDYSDGEHDRKPCRTLMGGTQAMRDAGEEYLPRPPGEHPEDWEARRDQTFLYNGFRRAVHALASRVFDRPVEILDVEQLTEREQSITDDDRSLVEFSYDLFTKSMAEGIAYIWVDRPYVPPERRPQTLADQQGMDLSPYLTDIKPCDLFYWKHEPQGRQKLIEVRFYEGYIDSEMERQRRIRRVWLEGGRVKWETYVIDPDAPQTSGRDSSWVAETPEQVLEGLSSIPLFPVVFGDRVRPMYAKPPLSDLAEMNIAHWQSSSDQRNILHVARVPILFAKMLSSTDEPGRVVIGPHNMISADSPNAEVRFVEHTGAAIGAGRIDLADLEARMAAMGIELLLPQGKPGALTATARAIDKSTEESALQIMAKALKHSLRQAIQLMADWEGIEGTVEIRALIEMRGMEEITRRTFLEQMKLRGVLGDDVDVELEIEEAEEEGARRVAAFSALDRVRRRQKNRMSQLRTPEEIDEDDLQM